MKSLLKWMLAPKNLKYDKIVFIPIHQIWISREIVGAQK